MKLLKFYTKTCCQCKALTLNLEGFNLIPIIPVDCEENEDLVNKYQIRNLPTVILVDDEDNFLHKMAGASATRAHIEEVVKKALGNGGTTEGSQGE